MELDGRKRTLLQVIVVNYVRRAEPVGSHFLAAQENLGVRSATIRNELAEMTELGYLRQPHTSAGRIPSDLGYRYYVDHLMTWERLPANSARAVRGAIRLNAGDLEQLLTQTCRVLSSLTGYTSLATPPASPAPTIRHANLVQMAPDSLLAVVVLENGRVIHRFVEFSRRLSPAEVTRLSNALDLALRDLPISRILQAHAPAAELPGCEELFQALLAAIDRGVRGEEGDLFVGGASHILEQPEFREADRVEPLVRLLEERKSAYELLQRLVARSDVAVSIGQENPHAALQEVSVVGARYAGAGRTAGWVGVLGPTRMNYEHAVAAVRYAASALTETLAREAGE